MVGEARLMKRLSFLFLLFLSLLPAGALVHATPQRPPAPPAGIFGPPRGMALFQANCANCHTAQGVEVGGRVSPALTALNAMPPERIYDALVVGKMKDQATSLNDRQK